MEVQWVPRDTKAIQYQLLFQKVSATEQKEKRAHGHGQQYSDCKGVV